MSKMWKRTVIACSIFLLASAVGAVLLLLSLRTGERQASEPTSRVALDIWLVNKELIPFVRDYEKQHPLLDADIRTFRSYEQLYNELTASISANSAPQLVEINSFYGTVQLAQSHALLPLEKLYSNTYWQQLRSELLGAFHYNGSQWAVPVGAALPVLFYNKDLLHYSGLNQATNWTELLDAGQIGEAVSASKQADGQHSYWGLVTDHDVPWYMDNLVSNKGTSTTWTDVFQLWHRMIDEQRLMPPVEHHLATSDFIDGRSIFFLASSEKRPLLEKSIGGKFAIGMTPLLDTNHVIPKVNGLAVLTSSMKKERAAAELVSYMTEPFVQQQMLQKTAQLPARTDTVEQLSARELGEMDTRLLRAGVQITVRAPRAEDKEDWIRLQKAIEALELEVR